MIGSLIHRTLVRPTIARALPDDLWHTLWLWALPRCDDCLRHSEFSHYV